MDKIIIGITGHRLLTDQQIEKIKPVLEKAVKNIVFVCKEQDPHCAFMALTPISEGADTLFAKVALSLSMPLQIILPYEKSEYLKDFSTNEKRLEFEEIYDKIDPTNKEELNTLNGNDRNELFFEMGVKIVNQSNYLIAIWNEKDAKGKGGTADIVAYATEKNKEILVINPEAEMIRISHLNKGNQDKDNIPSNSVLLESDNLNDDITSNQNKYDKEADKFYKKYKFIWTLAFIIGLIEALAFSVIVAYHLPIQWKFPLTLIEFICIASIIMLLLFGQIKKLHSQYVCKRIISERLRIKQLFSDLGFYFRDTPVSPIYFSLNEKPEFAILSNLIRRINITAYSTSTFEIKKEHLLSKLTLDQENYHRAKKERFEKKNKIYKKIRKVLFVVFISCVLLDFLLVLNNFIFYKNIHFTLLDFSFFYSSDFEKNLLFITLFIPPTIAACEALKYLYEWEKIINRSEAMSEYFKSKAKTINTLENEAELELILDTINRDMLIETLDWEKYIHYKNEVPT